MSIRYRGRLFHVETASATANGKRFGFDRIKSKDVVVILAIADGKIVMEHQRRPVIKKTILELPAGRIERGEKLEAASLRELEEETGYRASRAKRLFSYYVGPGLFTEINHNFLLTGLRKGRVHLDKDEVITVKLVSQREALSMIKSNRIVDGKTIACILWAVQNRVI